MNKDFCVYLTRYSGTKLPRWYIGSSSVKNVENNYNGSVKSKKWKEIYNLEQKENKLLFKTRIISKHTTRKEALEEELRVQILHNVTFNDLYFNESYASPNGFFGRSVKGKNHHSYGKSNLLKGKKGKPMSEETKDKLRKINLGKPAPNKGRKAYYDDNNKRYMCFSDDSRVIEGLVKIKPPKQKIKKNRKPVSEQTKQKISKSMKGIKTNSQKTRQLISNSLKNLIRDTIHIFNNKNEIIYICNISFIEFCKNNNLPYQSFKSSYRKNGSPILLTNQSKSQLKEISHLMYEGWYAKKI